MQNNLQHKLHHFQSPPPAGVWSKIEQTLDEEKNLSEMLFNYRQQPPAAVWASIQSKLDKGDNDLVAVMPRRKRLVAFAAAASLITAIVFTFLLTNTKEEEPQLVNSPLELPVQSTESTALKPAPLPVNPPVEKAFINRTSVTVQSQPVRRSVRAASYRPASNVEGSDLQIATTGFAITGRFIPQKAREEDVVDLSEFDNYMVYSNAEGMAMKLPKKLFSLVHCTEGDNSCKDRINNLQLKLSQNGMTNDFMGIVEIINHMR